MAENRCQTAPASFPLALVPAQGSRPPLLVGPSKKFILIRPSSIPGSVVKSTSQDVTPLESSSVGRPFCVINQNFPLETFRNPMSHVIPLESVVRKTLSPNTIQLESTIRRPLCVINQNAVQLETLRKPLSHAIPLETAARRPLTVINHNAIPNNNNPAVNVKTNVLVKSLSLSQAKSSRGKNPIDAHIAHAREVSNKLLSSCAQGLDTGSTPKQTAQPSEVITAPLVKKSLSVSQAKSSKGKNPIDAHIAHAQEVSNELLSSCAQGLDTGSTLKQTAQPSEVITAPFSAPTHCRTENLEENIVTLQSSSADESDLSDDVFQPRIRKKKVISNNAPSNETENKRTNCRKIAGCRKTPEELASIVEMAREKSLSDPSFTKIHESMPSFMADYVITEATFSPNPLNEGDGDFWTAKIRINISNKAEVYEWLSNYENMSACDFRVSFSKKENSKRLVFKKEYHCHHNTKPRESSRPPKTEKCKNWKSKNTTCPSIIRFTIKQKSMDWSSDYLLKEYPCEIVIKHQHNHPVKCADAQRLRRPSAEVKEKFVKLFAQGHSPISAIETHKFDLMMEHGENYIYVAADGTKCPTNFWVYKLFKKVCVGHYGPQSGEGLIESLRAFALKYNDEMKSECIKVELQNDRDLVVAICTPMMKRTHELLRASGEMIFVDSSGNMDALNCRVFPVMTHSVAGALPRGILIVSSESEEVLSPALELLKGILPPKAFYGRGANVGPKIAMTDDCTSERNSLKSAFPGIVLLLCLFHLLQAFWRYLWKRDHHVEEKLRPQLFYVLRDLAYAPDQSTFDQKVEEAMEDPSLLSHKNVLDHIKKYIKRSEEWALFQRNDLLTRGNNTNNYSEATVKIIIDKVLRRTKTFNVVQLVDFLVTRLTVYIEMRVSDVLNNRSLNAFRSRYFIRPEKLEKLVSEKLPTPPDCYKVTNTAKGTTYIVIMSEEICSCPEGKCGKPCKHLCKVVQDFNLSSELLLPREQVGEETKLVLFEILHGHRNIPSGWFRMLHQSGSVPATTQDENLECPDNCLPDADAEQLNMSPSDPADNNEDSSTVLSTEKELKDLFASWVDSLKKRPDVFLKPCQKLIEANKKIKDSDSALVSAMMCFGKRTGEKPLCVKKFNQQKTIPVQPTAKARRKVHLEGRHAQHGGRPPKDMFQPPVAEHSYNTQTSGTKRKANEAHWASIPNKRVYPAPHALQVCVNANKTIGQNHSKK